MYRKIVSLVIVIMEIRLLLAKSISFWIDRRHLGTSLQMADRHQAVIQRSGVVGSPPALPDSAPFI